MLGLNDYQRMAARTLGPESDHPIQRKLDLAILALGLDGEEGEAQELLKKYLGHGHPIDPARLEKELGDRLWYISAIATRFHLSLEDVAQENLNKLQARYPQGFDPERSKSRGRDDL